MKPRDVSFPFLAMVFLSLGRFPHPVAAADCLIKVQASLGGHYNSKNSYQIDRRWYIAGQDPAFNGGEMRNWFMFFVPTLPQPLARAEMRLYAGGVSTADSSEQFEL